MRDNKGATMSKETIPLRIKPSMKEALDEVTDSVGAVDRGEVVRWLLREQIASSDPFWGPVKKARRELQETADVVEAADYATHIWMPDELKQVIERMSDKPVSTVVRELLVAS